MRNLSIVLGIALSADDDPPVRIMACHALSACKCFITILESHCVAVPFARRPPLNTPGAIRRLVARWDTNPSLGGSWIRDPLAQTCLLDLLRRTEAENGWPWTSLAQALSQNWRMTAE